MYVFTLAQNYDSFLLKIKQIVYEEVSVLMHMCSNSYCYPCFNTNDEMSRYFTTRLHQWDFYCNLYGCVLLNFQTEKKMK